MTLCELIERRITYSGIVFGSVICIFCGMEGSLQR